MKESRKGFGLGQPGPAAREKSGSRSDAENQESEYLDGQMLIAMPVMEDERFQRSVIYMCAHSSEGAMGIIVNRPAGSIDFPEPLDAARTSSRRASASCLPRTPRR